MKKRLLAVVLAICMIASSCVLFASAAELSFTAGRYYFAPNSAIYVGDLDKDGQMSNSITLTPKDKPEISGGATSVTKDNISGLYTFSPEFSKISKYITNVSGDIIRNGDGTAYIRNVVVEFGRGKAYHVNSDQKYADNISISETAFQSDPINSAKGQDVLAELVYKLYTVTTGIRISGDNYHNLVADEIAQVKMTVTRNSGASMTGKNTVVVSDSVKDLMDGDTVTLETSFKNPEDEKFYKFNCWVDGSGKVVSTNPTLNYYVEDNASFYAVYVETVNRYRITFSASDGGKIEAGTTDITKREIIKGTGQISVLQGKNIKFTLVPDEGYQVGKVIVTDNEGNTRNITSLVSLLTGATDWKTLIRATLTNTIATPTMEAESLGTPSYTFKNVQNDLSIDVTFIKQEPLKAGEGKELPTIAAEGLTLMSAEEAVSEAEAAKAAAGEAAGGAAGGTTVPGENGAAGGAAAASGSVVNPATGSGTSGAVAVFAALSVAAGAAFICMKKKEN